MTEQSVHLSDAAKARLVRRNRANRRLKALGALAIMVAAGALATLLYTVGARALKAVYEYSIDLPRIEIAANAFDPEQDPEIQRARQRLQTLMGRGIFTEATAERELAPKISLSMLRSAEKLAADATAGLFPHVTDQAQVIDLNGLISGAVSGVLSRKVHSGEIARGTVLENTPALLSDDAQVYLKGRYGRLVDLPSDAAVTLTPVAAGGYRLSADAPVFQEVLTGARAALGRQAEAQAIEAAMLRRAEGRAQARLEAAGPAARADAEERLTAAAAAADASGAALQELQSRAAASAGSETLTDKTASVFARAPFGWLKLTNVSGQEAQAVLLLPTAAAPTEPTSLDPAEWRLVQLGAHSGLFGSGVFTPSPEAERGHMSDLKVVGLETLRERGAIDRAFAFSIFTNADSREAERAGVRAALIGTAWTMLVTLIGAAVIGAASGIYLEEFARKGWFSNMIEVNINNLAAVPSIIFGLFGLMFLLTGFEVGGFSLPLIGEVGTLTIGGWFADMRSFPIIGGTVLALMTLPTVVIATRAALRSVPQPIRDAAIGLGASRNQTVFHHVAPLAAPGILTGVIIGMAQALGETAPLLMIGMIGFFQSVPQSAFEPATVMPGLIYSWADHPEVLFKYKTSLAIIVLLAFLLLMNALAIILRRRFERRW